MTDQPDSHTTQADSSLRYWLAAGWAIFIAVAYALRQISLHASIIQSLLDTSR